jgi:multidrug efflux system membrane fusion protein
MLERRVALRRESPGAVPEEEVATIRATVARRREALSVAEAMRREAEAASAEAEAQTAEAKAALTSAQARLALATKAKNDTIVRSPLKGVVRRRHVTVGQYVRAGDPVAELVDRSRLRLRFRVSEAESVRLATGQELTFLVPSLSSTKHRGRLVHVDEAASSVTRMVECLGEVVEPDPALKPGFFAVATVETKLTGAIAVPESALLPGEQGWMVYVVEDGRAKRRPVALGLRTRDGRVEIREGLAVGATLVVEGANVLSEDAAVALQPAAPAGTSPAKP